MEFFWVFAYNLKYPVTIGVSIGLLLCVIMFMQGLAANNRSPSKSGDPRVAWSVMSGMLLGVLWAFVYAVPAPDYNVKYVNKPVTVEKTKIVKVFAGTRVVEPTWDQRFKYCKGELGETIDRCEQFANMAKAPRVVKNVIRTVTKTVPTTLEQNIQWCRNETDKTLDDCVTYAKTVVNFKPRVINHTTIKHVPIYKGEKIVIRKDSYFDLWSKCNEAYSLERAPNDQFGALRNARMAICKEVAIAGSR